MKFMVGVFECKYIYNYEILIREFIRISSTYFNFNDSFDLLGMPSTGGSRA